MAAVHLALILTLFLTLTLTLTLTRHQLALRRSAHRVATHHPDAVGIG